MLHHTIAPEAKHDLGTIVSLYGSTPYWKDEFKNRKVSILEMDQKQMRRYNLRDCVVLHQAIPNMLADLKELKLEGFYRDEVQPLIACLMELIETGVLRPIKNLAQAVRDRATSTGLDPDKALARVKKQMREQNIIEVGENYLVCNALPPHKKSKYSIIGISRTYYVDPMVFFK
jgi:hypothetical protein